MTKPSHFEQDWRRTLKSDNKIWRVNKPLAKVSQPVRELFYDFEPKRRQS